MGDHDALFKRAFSVPEHAGGELRSVLPAAVVAKLELSALALVPGSFVDPEMADRHTDLLFRAPLAGSDSPSDLYLYFLLEHQSEPDPLMPWRVLCYLQRIWAAVLREEPKRRSLPPVVAVVVHHGPGGWTAPRRLHELVEGLDALPELAPLIPDVGLLIDDLAGEDDAALGRRPLRPFPKVALWLLRDGRSLEAFLEHLGAWAHELEQLVRDDPEQRDIQVVLRYILRVTGEVPFEVVRQRIAEVAPAAEESMATLEDQLIQKGIEKGIEKGIQQGIEKGRIQAMRDGLVRQLRVRFGGLDTETEERIHAAEAEELDRWIERVVTVSRIEDLFER